MLKANENNRHLESSAGRIRIDLNDVVNEHAMATITCLASALLVFRPSYPSSDRELRVIRGLHGFYIFADECWLDYTLQVLSLKRLPFSLEENLRALSERLVDHRGSSSNWVPCETVPGFDHLNVLKQYPGLLYNANFCLRSRSQASTIVKNALLSEGLLKTLSYWTDVYFDADSAFMNV
jgi:hypothetical protein